MRDRGRIKAPSSDPIENLRTRLSEQERQIADLYRRVAQPVAATPASGSGCVVAAFNARIDSDFELPASPASGSQAYAKWTFTSAAGYATTDVYQDIDGDHNIYVPSGLWSASTVLDLYSYSTPTSGYVEVSIDDDFYSYDGDRVIVPWRVFADRGDEATALMAYDALFPASAPGVSYKMRVRVTNRLNVSIGFYDGHFVGHQLSAPDYLVTT